MSEDMNTVSWEMFRETHLDDAVNLVRDAMSRPADFFPVSKHCHHSNDPGNSISRAYPENKIIEYDPLDGVYKALAGQVIVYQEFYHLTNDEVLEVENEIETERTADFSVRITFKYDETLIAQDGWENFETQNVFAWIASESGPFKFRPDWFTTYDQVVAYMEELGVHETPDGVSLTDPKLDKEELDYALQQIYDYSGKLKESDMQE